MDGRRRQRWNNYRGSQNRKPPRGCWQLAVPSWEKEFCKVVGSLEWGTLLQMKKFMHLYDNVIKWNDSAGEEAFCNAKKRYWAEINGVSCDIPLPDPDLYIEKINWDSEIDPELLPDLEWKLVIPNREEDHDPVVIFGDSLMPNQAFSPTGWGDVEENLEVPANHSSANYGDPWEQNWGNSNDMAVSGWPGYLNNTWQFSDGSGPGYMSWGGGWNNDGGWSYANNHFNYVGPYIEDKRGDGVQGLWNDSNVTTANAGRYVSSYRTSRAQANDHCRNHISRNDEGRHKAPYWGKQSAGQNSDIKRVEFN
ncbi:hypothetical protein Pfo_003182 [Paulownia fortunei]|nr:hypothetical protein Pfo_003182 [Paulownia fortunei]